MWYYYHKYVKVTVLFLPIPLLCCRSWSTVTESQRNHGNLRKPSVMKRKCEFNVRYGGKYWFWCRLPSTKSLMSRNVCYFTFRMLVMGYSSFYKLGKKMFCVACEIFSFCPYYVFCNRTRNIRRSWLLARSVYRIVEIGNKVPNKKNMLVHGFNCPIGDGSVSYCKVNY